MLLVVFSLFFAVPAQAETPEEGLARARAVIDAQCSISLKTYQGERKEDYSKLKKDERKDRRYALEVESEQILEEQKINEREIRHHEKKYYKHRGQMDTRLQKIIPRLLKRERLNADYCFIRKEQKEKGWATY